MSVDYTRVTWYEHDCDWITKYCDDHHTRSALIPTAALAVLGDRDTLREKIAEALYNHREDWDSMERAGIVRRFSWAELKAGRAANPMPDYPHLYDDFMRRSDAVLAVLYGEGTSA